MYQLRYSKQAIADLVQIKRYISRDSGSNAIAVRYTERLRQECRKLAELPGTMGRARPELMEEIRSFPYRNYIIFFKYSGSIFEIVSIIEGHRDIEGIFHK